MTDRIVTPEQYRYNDPFQQTLYQYNILDSRVYMSRINNMLLQAIGNDGIIEGFHVLSQSFTSNIFTVTLGPGLLIQDSTLIKVTEDTTISIDLNTFTDCDSYVVIYTSYQFVESPELNLFRIKISHVSDYGTVISPISDPWNHDRNRTVLNIFKFIKDVSVTELHYPEHIYISGQKYHKRGVLNFTPSDDPSTVTPDHHDIYLTLSNEKLFARMFDEDLFTKRINYLKRISSTHLRLNIDEYKPLPNLDDYYSLYISNPSDIESFTIVSDDLDANHRYILSHNLGTENIMVQVYDGDDDELIWPYSIEILDLDRIRLDFSNLSVDLAANYKINIIHQNISTFTLSIPPSAQEQQLSHNKKSLLLNVQIKTPSNLLLNTQDNIQLINENTLKLIAQCNIQENIVYTILIHDNISNVFKLRDPNVVEQLYTLFHQNITDSNLDVDHNVVITHNLLTLYPVVQVYDVDRNIIVPGSIEIIDLNSIRLNFYPPFDPYLIMIYSHYPEIHTITDTDTITLDEEYKVLQVYESSEVIQPLSITKTPSASDYTIEFESAGSYDVVGISGVINYISNFNNTDLVFSGESYQLIVNHTIDTLFPLIQVYLDNEVVYPENIQIISASQFVVTFAHDTFTSGFVFACSAMPRQLIEYWSDNSYTLEFTTTDASGGSILVTHDLNTVTPLLQLYANNSADYTATMTIVDANNILISDLPITYQILNYKIVVFNAYRAP